MKESMMKKDGFQLDVESGYFKNNGVDVMAFMDIYPVGHQAGVSIIMYGNRVATNGDIRFEQTPGQWQPVPKQLERKLDKENNTITTTLRYPDEEQHMKGFNPLIYPDYEFEYEVKVQGEGNSVVVTVDLDRPIPKEYVGKMCFNMELVPGSLFGKPWIMDKKQGIFPRQPNGPTLSMPGITEHAAPVPEVEKPADLDHLTSFGNGYSPYTADNLIAAPYAVGKRFTVRPDDPYNRFTIESKESELKLYDGRMNHNNGWFVVSSEIPAGKDKGAVRWVITPNIVDDWLYRPVIQISQVGYHPESPKAAVIELDQRDTERKEISLYKITENGEELVYSKKGKEWGKFLRYNYLKFDFSDIKEENLYKITYGDTESSVFRIAEDIYDRGVWQPVLEYFLPVQMCHMRVNEKYRVWHDLCHNDDARMAPVNHGHFDGYAQGASTLTKYQPGEHVPGLNVGGWHDAGDFDLRIESQAGEAYILTLAYEEFGVNYDVTSIDQQAKVTEIHQPDGKNDILQQIEHGMLTVVGGYNTLGRLYRGIICKEPRQYVLLGDPSSMTRNIPGDEKERWVFTEENPPRELETAAQMAASSRALKGFNDELSAQSLKAAEDLYEKTDSSTKAALSAKLHAATELFLTTKEEKYKAFIISCADFIVENILSSETDLIMGGINDLSWIVCRVVHQLEDKAFTEKIRQAMAMVKENIEQQSKETPYEIPYSPHIWGAGWKVQRLGFEYYFLHKAFPDIFEPDLIFHALDFVLGCHPGSNTASFASGVGAKSATTAYGMNRADWSYIPGGVVSGTALIRPDFPELLEFPFLWQQTEYVLGGGSSHYMFLVLTVIKLLNR